MTEPTFDPRRKAAIRELIVQNAATHGRVLGRKRTAFVVTLVLLAVGISGGGVAYALGTGLLETAPVASPTPTPIPTPAETPTPTAPPTATSTHTPTPTIDAADPSTWTIGFDGVGPAKLGMSLTDAAAALPTFDDATDPLCAPGQRNFGDRAGTSSLVLFGRAASDDDLVTIIVSGGRVGASASTRPHTAEGIGVGSTLEELTAAYDDLAVTGTYSNIDGTHPRFYGLSGAGATWITFEVLHGVVDRILVGPSQTIPSEYCPA
ncbi:hypothetical protein ACFVU2_18805 [Leifsonia sp. NPDC058194]|uniref:hypothetical protein n=1 Tax=Leifsonia sp. NPDC058194 TaxID=3346374 RepID=UPI0036D77EFE